MVNTIEKLNNKNLILDFEPELGLSLTAMKIILKYL